MVCLFILFNSIFCPAKVLRFDSPVYHCFFFNGLCFGSGEGNLKTHEFCFCSPSTGSVFGNSCLKRQKEIACRKMVSRRRCHCHLFFAVEGFEKSLFIYSEEGELLFSCFGGVFVLFLLQFH